MRWENHHEWLGRNNFQGGVAYLVKDIKEGEKF